VTEPSKFKRFWDWRGHVGKIRLLWQLALSAYAASRAVSILPGGWHPVQYGAKKPVTGRQSRHRFLHKTDGLGIASGNAVRANGLWASRAPASIERPADGRSGVRGVIIRTNIDSLTRA
jgi:hypothetical protein